MKTKTTCLILIFLSYLAIAQEFSKTYDGNTQLFTSGTIIESTATNYTATISATQNSLSYIRHISTNFDGTIESIKRFSSVDPNFEIKARQVITLPDDTHIISGTYSPDVSGVTIPLPFLMSINNDGSINWSKKINTNNSAIADIKLLSDNTILLTFRFSDNSFTVTRTIYCKLDTNGNLNTFKELNLQFNPILNVIPNNDGTFDILLSRGDLLNINNDLSAINWQRKYYHETGINFTKTANGDYIFMTTQVEFGHSTVFRTDASGNVLWAKYIEMFQVASPYLTLGCHFITEDSTGNIIVNVRNAASFGSLIITLDSNGNYISNRKTNTKSNHTKLLNNNEYIVGSVISGTGDQDFAFEKRSYTTNYGCDITLNHTIATGDAMELSIDPATLTTIQDFTLEDINIASNNETLPVNETEFCDMFLSVNEEQLLENELDIFPNPTHNKVWVKTNRNLSEIKIYNYLGQHIDTSNQSFIDMSNYASGIYFLRIKIDNSIVLKKIMKK